MQVLVMYYSRTGNTAKLAEAIAQGVSEVEDVRPVVKEAGEITEEDFLDSQGIIAGSPVYYGSMAAELKQVFDQFVHLRDRMEDKVGAAFATSGDEAGGRETTMLSILQAMLINGMIIVGDPLDATGHYGVSCPGVPDARILSNGRKLGRRVASLAKRLSS